MNHKQSKKKGFTLIELLVVITIIGVLAGIAFVGFGDVFGTAGRTAAQKNLKTKPIDSPRTLDSSLSLNLVTSIPFTS